MADERKGALVVRTPVALHVTFSERPGGGNAYPNSLMGVIAFVRQAFLDAQHYQSAQRFAENTAAPPARRLASRPAYEPRSKPCSRRWRGACRWRSAATRRARFCARSTWPRPSSSIRSSPTRAKRIRLRPISRPPTRGSIVGLDYPTRPTSLAPDADEPLSALRTRANAPEGRRRPRQGRRAVRVCVGGARAIPRTSSRTRSKPVQNGLSRDEAIKALTLQAATIAGAADRVGSLEVGKIANVLVTEGDLFDEKMTIKHVFVEGRRGQPGRRGRDPSSAVRTGHEDTKARRLSGFLNHVDFVSSCLRGRLFVESRPVSRV